MIMTNKIYIVLTDTSSILSKLIQLYTKEPYNHASISLDDELNEVYSFGRKQVGNPFNGGFVKEDMKRGLFTHAKCAIYSLMITDNQLEKMKRYIHEIEKQQEEYRYHFLGLFGFLFHRPIYKEKAFFCSQFVATMLNKCHVIDFDQPLTLVAPSDLQEIAALKLEFEGELKAYVQQNNEWCVSTYLTPVEI